MVKKLPVMEETRVRSLVREDPLEEGMATHSHILAWRIPWTEEPGRLQPMELHSHTRLKRLSTHGSCGLFINVFTTLVISLKKYPFQLALLSLL